MKCIVTETSHERINAHPVTDEDGTPHVYATMAEARAELRANGYSYNRANDHYYIKGTEYRAYIIREDSEEFTDVITTTENVTDVSTSADHAESYADAAEYAAKNATPAEARTFAEYAKAAAEDARRAARYNLIHYFSDHETSGYSAQVVKIQRADVERAEAAAKRAEEAAQRAEAPQYTRCDADIVAFELLEAYAEAIGERPTYNDPETVAAYACAVAELCGKPNYNDPAFETVADMVEAIAEHAKRSNAYTTEEIRAKFDSEYLVWDEPETAPTYQRAELEAFLGEYVDAYDVDAIEDEATKAGRWTPEAVRDLMSICQRHELKA